MNGPKAKVTTEELRRLRDKGLSYQKIGNMFGLTRQNIQHRVNHEKMTEEQKERIRHRSHAKRCTICQANLNEQLEDD